MSVDFLIDKSTLTSLALVVLGFCSDLSVWAQAPGAVPSTSVTLSRDTQPATIGSTAASGDTLDYLQLHRQHAVAKLLHDPRAPLDSVTYHGLRYFPAADSFRILAEFRPSTDTALVRFPTSDGRTRDYRVYGQLVFPWQGQTRELTVYEMIGLAAHPLYGDHLFLPFRDDTNGDLSYGGGRYIDLSRARIAAGDYTLDFNLAYNPWCAYAKGYSCPVPPARHTLDFAVTAGEAAFVPSAPAKN